MEYNEIVSLMQEMNRTQLTRIRIEKEGFKLELEKNMSVVSTPVPVPIPKAEAEKMFEAVSNEDKVNDTVNNEDKVNETGNKSLPDNKLILAPMVGTFYAQPGPDKPPYVNVGDKVKKGQPVCIIEAMKLMNEIESEVEGEILECLVKNEEMVEFGQPLFLLK